MSLIAATYNTETKELTVTIDGKLMENTQSVMMRSCKEMYDGEEECYGYCEIYCAETEENGVTYMNSARANKLDSSDKVSEYLAQTLFKNKN